MRLKFRKNTFGIGKVYQQIRLEGLFIQPLEHGSEVGAATAMYGFPRI